MTIDIDEIKGTLPPNWGFSPLTADLTKRFGADHESMLAARCDGSNPAKSPIRSFHSSTRLAKSSLTMAMKTPCNTQAPKWRKTASLVLDLLYPPVCTLCHANLTQGRALCDTCALDLPRLTDPFCQSCGEMFHGNISRPFVCPNCSDLSYAFEFARPAMVRDTRTLDLIHRLKYRREIHLADELSRLARESFDDPRMAPAVDASWPLVPVPLHRKRLQHRYFNQALEIALSLTKYTGLPVLKALRRIRNTDTQTRLNRKQRMENLLGAFEITRHGHQWIESSPSGAILIDDVFTTGSTVNECAKTLRHAGFRKVFVVTVMRG
jgi:ComF family protein